MFKLFSTLRNQYLRRELVLAADTLLSLAASLLALYINRLASFPTNTYRFFTIYLITAVVATVILSVLFRTPRIIIRHITFKDLLPFTGVALGKSALLFLVLAILGQGGTVLALLSSLDFFLTSAFLLGIRLAMIVVYDIYLQRQQDRLDPEQILVYGTSDKSVATVKRLQTSSHYQVIGFLERNDDETKYLLERLPVFRFKDDKRLNRIILGRNIDAVLFARDTDALAEENGVIPFCNKNKVKTLITPSIDEVADGQALLHPRNVRIEDLLGRKEITISLDEVKTRFEGKVVMVTGAAGSIGSELVRQLARFGVKKLILFDNAETPMHNLRLELEDRFPQLDFVPVIGDVRQIARLDYAFRTWRPQVVFHAAAYKHVPLMEENPCEAALVNVFGSRNVADKCLEYDVEEMVMISTDKAVNPTNVMGCTKRLAEIYVQSLGLAVEKGQVPGKTRFVTTRFGNVLGSNGSVIPRFREQIAKGGPVTVTHPEINRFFMTIPEACRLVMEAATMSSGTQLFVFDMGEPIKIDLLARRMITLAGFTPDKDIKIEYTGLRPGEKLYEEVLANDENTLPSFHERIRIARVREYEYPEARQAVERLTELAWDVSIPELLKLMQETVPEYRRGEE